MSTAFYERGTHYRKQPLWKKPLWKFGLDRLVDNKPARPQRTYIATLFVQDSKTIITLYGKYNLQYNKLSNRASECYRLNDAAQCRTTPSPARCPSNRLTSLQTITACEFMTFGMYAKCFLMGNLLSDTAIWYWSGVNIVFSCSTLVEVESESDWTGPGLSIISTTASSTFLSNSARTLMSFWLLDSSCSSRRIRTREVYAPKGK